MLNYSEILDFDAIVGRLCVVQEDLHECLMDKPRTERVGVDYQGRINTIGLCNALFHLERVIGEFSSWGHDIYDSSYPPH